MIEYYIDGSTKDQMIGVGIVKVNEFGFIEKYHFKVEHVNPTSNLAEGYALERTLHMIKENDLHKHEMIDIYTDCQKLHRLFLSNENMEYNRNNYFEKQEANHYYQHIRRLYIELISYFSNYPLFHCEKTNHARPLIKIHFNHDTNQKYHQYAHNLSRHYLKNESVPAPKVEFSAKRKDNTWYIVKDNEEVVAENKRPILALADAIRPLDKQTQIKLCEVLSSFIKNTRQQKIQNSSLKASMSIINQRKYL
ncbi:hypothetical protein [Bacillus marasmi]|uniref:hypothetical protein n=1 Tax=Bacillus marasmi TaxID=1926279 RepID=UPI0011CC8912|nr:hypothetical protein [Bacillus marasmi]